MSYSPWAQAFGSELTLGVNAPTVGVANGSHNTVNGNVSVDASQTISDRDFGYGDSGPTIGANVPTVGIANGDHNTVNGSIGVDASQTIADGDFGGFAAGGCFPTYPSGPLVGDIDVGVNAPTVLIGNGTGNVINGNIGVDASQTMSDGFDPGFHFAMA